jgi:hypothetical protein
LSHRFDSYNTSSPCDYSSPFDPEGESKELFDRTDDILFQLSSSSATAPTPPDSPSVTGAEPVIMDPLTMMSSADDVFFGANDLKEENQFWSM